MKNSSTHGKVNLVVDVAILNKVLNGRTKIELPKEVLRSKVIFTCSCDLLEILLMKIADDAGDDTTK